MATGILTWMHHRKGLNKEARQRLEALLRLSAEGIRRHKVLVTYTNIFVKKSWNAIAIGEQLDLPDMAQMGYEMLDEWCSYTRAHGIHEYLSPTYYVVDLDSLEKIAQWAGRAWGRQQAERAIQHMWADIAANWFVPGDRLGGAHSRDYDYLTGRSSEIKSRMESLLSGAPSPEGYVADPATVERTKSLLAWVPRMVCESWGDLPQQTASQYVGRRFSLGSSGCSRHNMDKVLTVNLAGDASTPMVNFLMDGRGDPYGIRPVTEADGHTKSRHLLPFVASVQRGPEVLLLASANPETWAPLVSRGPKRHSPHSLQTTGLSFDASGTPSCLLSHLVLPLVARVWSGEEEIKREKGEQELDPGVPVFLELHGVRLGLRCVYASTDGSEAAAPMRLVVDEDGLENGIMRLTWTHSEVTPEERSSIALWLRCEEDPEGGLSGLRSSFGGRAKVVVVEDRISLQVDGAEGSLEIEAHLVRGERIRLAGAEPAHPDALLWVNGRDMGREIWEGKAGI